MTVAAPHFLLYAEAAQALAAAHGGRRESVAEATAADSGRWRFVLKAPGGQTSLEATDEEPTAGPERLELLAVIRGLEALESPSRVTLVTGSRQLRRGLEFALAQWRENDWQWERYGRMTPVKNSDLWRRLDRLLEIHRVECRPAAMPSTDDLAPPPVVTHQLTARGRRLRIDSAQPASGKSEMGPPRIGAKSPRRSRNVQSKRRFESSNFLVSNLFRISDFVLRILKGGGRFDKKRSMID
jgi:ribonuclease HI